jgi:phage shock protein PspC (stress-responsive transcriptional regulator)
MDRTNTFDVLLAIDKILQIIIYLIPIFCIPYKEN